MNPLPPGALRFESGAPGRRWPFAGEHAEVAVLAALIERHELYGRATVRDVADAARISLGRCHDYLVMLRGKGLVAWEPGLAGTLRPLVTVVGPDLGEIARTR